jgi:hypothetical protein
MFPRLRLEGQMDDLCGPQLMTGALTARVWSRARYADRLQRARP